MKYIIFVFVLFMSLGLSKAFADTSDVHVDNTTTVCINGKCETTQGNVDRKEGGVSVHVQNQNNSSVTAPLTPTPTPTQSPKKDVHVTQKEQPTIFEQMISNFERFVVSWIHNG